MSNGDKPASPVKPVVIHGNHQVYLGLTKRDHFAAMAMQGLLAAPQSLQNTPSLSAASVEIADALLKALQQ